MSLRCSLPVLCAAVFLPTSFLPAAEPATIFVDPDVEPARFAADEIASALLARGDEAEVVDRAGLSSSSRAYRIVLGTAAEPDLQAELGKLDLPPLSAPGSFALRPTGSAAARTIWIIGSDAGGAMYGGLEVAEQIRLQGFDAIAAMDRSPHFAMRGVKFNLPLDVRTPSYTDMSDAGQANIGEVWSFDFWREFIDRLARDRYNYVSLWNLHPFPSLVRVPGYEDIALDDVWRSTVEFAEDYSTRAVDVVNDDMLAHVEVVRVMTMDEKIAFWRRVMEYGRDRNIDFYVITWNLYTYGTGGKHGITGAIDNPATTDYFRQSVAALLRTYPLLRGIGVTAGENLGDHSSGFQDKEDWLFATYGQGVLDAAQEHPGRAIRFIHRQHETRAPDIAATFAPLIGHPDVDFIFSFKYAQAHVMSSTTQTFHREFVDTLGEFKTIWTLRNDDALLFRWGAPDFVRAFLQGIPPDVTQGIYYGSDMWIWGREFLSLDPDRPRQLEIAKHWYDWMLWGRLGYDPTLGNERIAALLGQRFPEVPGQALFDAWQHASLIYPLTTGFHWGQFDFQWYIEACRSRPGPARTESGFHDVERFITLAPHPGTDNVAIPDYIEAVVAQREVTGTTPRQVAARLHEHAGLALAAAEAMDAQGNKELQHTLDDIRAMALLGEYYGWKIAGATDLALYRRTGDASQQQAAIRELERAAAVWRRYTGLAASLYRNPVWTNRVGLVDWQELNAEVERDVMIARAARGEPTPAPGASP